MRAVAVLLGGFAFREGELAAHHVVRLNYNVDQGGGLVPALDVLQFLVEDEGLRVSGRPQLLVEAINNVL